MLLIGALSVFLFIFSLSVNSVSAEGASISGVAVSNGSLVWSCSEAVYGYILKITRNGGAPEEISTTDKYIDISEFRFGNYTINICSEQTQDGERSAWTNYEFTIPFTKPENLRFLTENRLIGWDEPHSAQDCEKKYEIQLAKNGEIVQTDTYATREFSLGKLKNGEYTLKVRAICEETYSEYVEIEFSVNHPPLPSPQYKIARNGNKIFASIIKETPYNTLKTAFTFVFSKEKIKSYDEIDGSCLWVAADENGQCEIPNQVISGVWYAYVYAEADFYSRSELTEPRKVVVPVDLSSDYSSVSDSSVSIVEKDDYYKDTVRAAIITAAALVVLGGSIIVAAIIKRKKDRYYR